MKTIVLLLLLAFAAPVFGQEKAKSEKQEEYCLVRITNIVFSRKLSIVIDYGQLPTAYSDRRLREEETGRLKKFNSDADALNFMGQQDWKLVNALPVISAGSSCTQYIFKREIQ